MSTRKRYTDEFKVEAVQLTETSNATIVDSDLNPPDSRGSRVRHRTT